MGGAGISVQTAAVSSMRSSGEKLWSAPKSVVSPAGPPTANREVRGTPASLLRLSCIAAPLPQRGKIRGSRSPGVFEKKKRQLTAQSIDLRRASDPRIERVADRLGRSALIDQRQRDARVSGWLTIRAIYVWKVKVDSHGHKSLVKCQHSTRRRCIGLEGAVNTNASSVPLKHEPRVEGGGAAAKRRGRAGSVRSAAGGVGTPPPAAAMALDVQGGYRAMCGRSCGVCRHTPQRVVRLYYEQENLMGVR